MWWWRRELLLDSSRLEWRELPILNGRGGLGRRELLQAEAAGAEVAGGCQGQGGQHMVCGGCGWLPRM